MLVILVVSVAVVMVVMWTTVAVFLAWVLVMLDGNSPDVVQPNAFEEAS